MAIAPPCGAEPRPVPLEFEFVGGPADDAHMVAAVVERPPGIVCRDDRAIGNLYARRVAAVRRISRGGDDDDGGGTPALAVVTDARADGRIAPPVADAVGQQDGPVVDRFAVEDRQSEPIAPGLQRFFRIGNDNGQMVQLIRHQSPPEITRLAAASTRQKKSRVGTAHQEPREHAKRVLVGGAHPAALLRDFHRPP